MNGRTIMTILDNKVFTERNNINIDITYRCPLACLSCMRKRYVDKGNPIDGIDMSIESFEKITDFFTRINFCGQVSDPTAHPKFIQFLEICKRKRNEVEIHNAASHRSFDWYKKAFQAYPEAIWEFGLDGLPEDSHNYRKNQNGPKLWEVMKWASGEGYLVDWQWIYFIYNYRDVPKGYEMAKEHKINFITVHSDRWGKTIKHLKPPEAIMKCNDVYEVMNLLESGYIDNGR